MTTWTGSYIGVSGGGAWGSAVVRNDVTGCRPDAARRSQRRHHRRHHGIQRPERQCGAGLRGRHLGDEQEGELHSSFRPTPRSTTRSRSAGFPPSAAASATRRDNWLVYATAGGALANVENTVTATGRRQISERHWHWGWTAGAGVEVKLNHDWSAKVEYLYVGLQDKSYFNPAPSVAFPEQSARSARRSHRPRRRELQAALERARRLLQALTFNASFSELRFQPSRRALPRPARDPTAFPSRAHACRCRPRPAGRRPAATAAGGRCGCRRSSARRRPGSPRT